MQLKLEPFGLTPEQRAILLLLGAKGPMTQTQLCQLTSTEPSNLSVTLKRLIHSGYILKRPHPNDPRAFLVTPTPEGEAVIPDLEALSAQVEGTLLKGIDADALAVTLTTLAKMEQNLLEHEEG